MAHAMLDCRHATRAAPDGFATRSSMYRRRSQLPGAEEVASGPPGTLPPAACPLQARAACHGLSCAPPLWHTAMCVCGRPGSRGAADRSPRWHAPPPTRATCWLLHGCRDLQLVVREAPALENPSHRDLVLCGLDGMPHVVQLWCNQAGTSSQHDTTTALATPGLAGSSSA